MMRRRSRSPRGGCPEVELPHLGVLTVLLDALSGFCHQVRVEWAVERNETWFIRIHGADMCMLAAAVQQVRHHQPYAATLRRIAHKCTPCVLPLGALRDAVWALSKGEKSVPCLVTVGDHDQGVLLSRGPVSARVQQLEDADSAHDPDLDSLEETPAAAELCLAWSRFSAMLRDLRGGDEGRFCVDASPASGAVKVSLRSSKLSLQWTFSEKEQAAVHCRVLCSYPLRYVKNLSRLERAAGHVLLEVKEGGTLKVTVMLQHDHGWMHLWVPPFVDCEDADGGGESS